MIKIRKCLAEVLGENASNLSNVMLLGLMVLQKQLKNLDEEIAKLEIEVDALFHQNEVCKKLVEIPGVGKLIATILASVLGNGSSFKNGRHFAAFLGLVPKQHNSGGKEKLLGISKGGDTYIRTLLIHGARSVVAWACKKDKADKHSIWIKNLKLRSSVNITATALANKIARMAWAIVYYGTEYNPNHKSNIKKAGSLA